MELCEGERPYNPMPYHPWIGSSLTEQRQLRWHRMRFPGAPLGLQHNYQADLEYGFHWMIRSYILIRLQLLPAFLQVVSRHKERSTQSPVEPI